MGMARPPNMWFPVNGTSVQPQSFITSAIRRNNMRCAQEFCNSYLTYQSHTRERIPIVEFVNGGQLIEDAAEFGGQSAVEWALHYTAQPAYSVVMQITRGGARSGDIELLNWVEKQYINQLGPNGRLVTLMSGLRSRPNLKAFRWLLARAPNEWEVSGCAAYAIDGRLDLIRYARKRGCPWGETVCYIAARNGYIGLLKWLREAEAPFDANRIFEAAAAGGHTNITAWLMML
jgi:hypothetical protein